MTSNSKPSVSILLPFRDCAQTLVECLDSIQKQSMEDFELLAVNDHSQDNSVEVVSQYAESDPRIKILHSSKRGLVPALNLGLEQAQTDYIARMDGDDRMHPQRLELQYNHLQKHSEIVALGSFARLFPEEVILAGFTEYMRWQNSCISPEEIANEIYVESPLVHPSVMFRRQAVLKLGGYRSGMFPEDYDLWLRMHHSDMKMSKLPQELLEWRDYPDRTSRVDERCSRIAFDQLRALYLAREPRLLQHKDNFVIWGAGRKTRKRCRHLLDQGLTPSAWIDIDPRKIGNRLDGVPVVPPEWLQTQDKPFVLGYVANHGAREDIAKLLHAMDYQVGTNYLMVG